MKGLIHTYDLIGTDYGHHRRTDPRIAATVIHELGDAPSVLNVGAGTTCESLASLISDIGWLFPVSPSVRHRVDHVVRAETISIGGHGPRVKRIIRVFPRVTHVHVEIDR